MSLSISKQKFLELYAGTSVIDSIDLYFTEPASDIEVITKYLPSKLWRLNHLYTVVDKYGQRVRFKMNLAQHKVYAESLRHPRLIILKSRQQGISTLWLVSFFDDSVFYNDLSVGLMAQGSDEAEKLLTRTKILWEELDPSVIDFLCIGVDKDNTKEFSFNNGSSIFVRTSFRSATLQRLHISEYGTIANNNPERAKETKTGSLQSIATGNTVIVESTAKGHNDYKTMWDKALAYAGKLTAKDFKPVFLSWLEDPDCVIDVEQEATPDNLKYLRQLEAELNIELSPERKYFWIAQYRELGVEVYQEYPSTPTEAFMRNRDGAYYAALYLRLVRNRNREIKNLFDPNLPVQVAVDLGRNDFFVLVFFQTYIDGWRIINCYHNTGYGIKHYCEVMDEIAVDLKYDITDIILPHDAEVRDLTSDMTREEAFWQYGYRNTTVVPRTADINNDRELVRQALETFYIDPRAQYIIDCMLNYSKAWDSKYGVWRAEHEHNDHSHGADAIRQMVRGGKAYTVQRPKLRRRGLGADV